MFFKFQSVLIQAVVLQILSQVTTVAPLEMQIYYETLCYYSQEFFIKLFHPNFEQFGNAVKWTLIPFGNAHITRDNNGIVTGITCQHKEIECRGNCYQACGLRKINDYFTGIRFCSCFMVNKGECDALAKCCQTLGIDYNMLNTCCANGEGLQLLGYYGDIHNQAQPKIQGVPTIFIDGKKLTDEETDALYTNFCKFLCDRLTEPKPQICSSLPAPVPAPPPAK